MLFKLFFTEIDRIVYWAYLIWIWGCFLVIATLLTESLSLPDWMVHANRWLFSPLFSTSVDAIWQKISAPFKTISPLLLLLLPASLVVVVFFVHVSWRWLLFLFFTWKPATENPHWTMPERIKVDRELELNKLFVTKKQSWIEIEKPHERLYCVASFDTRGDHIAQLT